MIGVHVNLFVIKTLLKMPVNKYKMENADTEERVITGQMILSYSWNTEIAWTEDTVRLCRTDK